MRVKREPVLLVLTVLVLGLLFWSRGSQTQPRRSRRSKGAPVEFRDHPAPELDRVRPRPRDPLAWDRDLFREPSDTRPLPPLSLEPPPVPPLAVLLPPPAQAPEPALYGRLLRTALEPSFVPGLFAPPEESEASEPDGTGAADAGVVPGAGSLLNGLGYAGPPDDEDLTAEERAELVESWKRVYDWIKINEIELLFGQIRNPDRYGLAERPDEPVLFLEVDPRTGEERYHGQGPVPYARERVLDWAFADTVANRLELRRREIGDTVTPGQFPEVLDFGLQCVEARHEAPRALEIAEDVFHLLARQFPDDPAPRLGLARCYRAAFRLEDAYDEYTALLEGGFDHHADVHVMLAQLEADLRLFDAAEERFRMAERIGRTSWLVQWRLGAFLYQRGRFDEAVQHLQLAHRFEPSAAMRTVRAGIRDDLGAALLATGDTRGAHELFRQALNAEPEDQLALAGMHTVWMLDESLSAAELGADLEPDEFGFELLVALSCETLARGELTPESARQVEEALRNAAELDPVRAAVAWRALSYLAETTGYPEEAYQFIEAAYEADPTDPWVLYQRGRLLVQRDDAEGAEASFLGALSREQSFEDALVALGELAFGRGDHEAAERYYERAVSISDQRPELHARRGLNLLELDRLEDAQASFQRALSLAPEDPVARAGLAWCHYRAGDPARAIQDFADLDDLRRNQGEQDPFRLYAKAQMDRITDHLAKVVWSDRFERRYLRNGWHPEEMPSPTLEMEGGQLVFRGAFARRGQVRVFRTMAAPAFQSLEVVLTVGPDNNARVGVFVAKERQVRGGGSQPVAEVRLARHREGAVQVRVQESATDAGEEGYVDLGFPPWPKGRPVRVRIEREGEGAATTGRVLVDDFTVLEGAPLRNLFASTSDLRLGIFAEGEPGRACDLSVDQVEVVYTTR